MYTRLFSGLIIVLATMLHLPHSLAQPGPGPGMGCSGCQVSFATGMDLADTISDFVGTGPAAVIVEPGQAPGNFLVTLPDQSVFSVAPVGPLFRHQNATQRRMLQTPGGGLHLRSQTRRELQLRSALHQEASVIAEMLRLGWADFSWPGHGMEVQSPAGDRYCFQPDMQVFQQTAQEAIAISQDVDDSLVVTYPTGLRQRLHACAHDLTQLRDHVREEVQQELLMDIDGTFALDIEGQQRRFRLAPGLQWSGITGQPGFILEGDRIHLRYRDGWEQEIVEL